MAKYWWTTGTGLPPDGLDFGDLAYLDGSQSLAIGRPEGNPPSIFESLVLVSKTFTYNPDGTLATVVGGGVTKTFTYNADGDLESVSDGTITKTFNYNPDKSLSGVLIN